MPILLTANRPFGGSSPSMGSLLSRSSPTVAEQLSQFECPSKASGQLCSYRWNSTFAPQSCPFGGHTPDGAPLKPLRPVPAFICAEQLLGHCEAESSLVDGFQLCYRGFHLTSTQLLDVERLAPRLLAALWTETKSEGTKLCSICLESVLGQRRPFGILQNCSHVFCAQCILPHLALPPTASRANKCPVCSKETSKFIVSTGAPPASDRKRAQMFDMQAQGNGALTRRPHGSTTHLPNSNAVLAMALMRPPPSSPDSQSSTVTAASGQSRVKTNSTGKSNIEELYRRHMELNALYKGAPLANDTKEAMIEALNASLGNP